MCNYNMILSELHRYKSPIILYGHTSNVMSIYDEIQINNKKLFNNYNDIDYAYYPVICTSGYIIQNIKYGIIIARYTNYKYLSIYVPKISQSIYTYNTEQWWNDILNGIEYKYYFDLNIYEVFDICLKNLSRIFNTQYEYVYAYEQILKLNNIANESYFYHEQIIYLLSCMLIKKQVELIDIDANFLN